MLAVLHTARLALRAPRPDDAGWIAEGIARPAVLRWLTSPPSPYRRADAEAWLARETPPDYDFVVEEAGAPLGVVTLPRDAVRGELGYWLREEAWGRGIMAEAAEAAIALHFSRGTDDLASGHLLGNGASRAVLRKLGFEDDGLIHRHSNYHGGARPIQSMRLTRAAWMARRTLPTLTTPRLHLRPLTQADAPGLARLCGDPSVAPMIFVATSPWPEAEAARLIAQDAWTGALGFRLAICLRDGRLIGMVGVSAEPHVFYAVDPAHWQRGYMTEALRALLPALFVAFPLDAVGAEVFHDNPASARTLAALGFVCAGSGTAQSRARLEPAPVSLYRLSRSDAEALS